MACSLHVHVFLGELVLYASSANVPAFQCFHFRFMFSCSAGVCMHSASADWPSVRLSIVYGVKRTSVYVRCVYACAVGD